ncbi:hypothetical protein [Conchiformibius kuhniae]|uniref:Uncharacterized protein n=1 Tax=Conchiformibius kuhniae TaxID=211502 RepID=A0A8T9MRV2_9NEIS|nr:hypothetical protein [Conchiformibius kuhniae]UOP04630.1 hypothetical protein LVJ77_10465 [Conchiformibius kuhniae]
MTDKQWFIKVCFNLSLASRLCGNNGAKVVRLIDNAPQMAEQNGNIATDNSRMPAFFAPAVRQSVISQITNCFNKSKPRRPHLPYNRPFLPTRKETP